MALHSVHESEKGDKTGVNWLLREGAVGISVVTEISVRRVDTLYLIHMVNLDHQTNNTPLFLILKY